MFGGIANRRPRLRAFWPTQWGNLSYKKQSSETILTYLYSSAWLQQEILDFKQERSKNVLQMSVEIRMCRDEATEVVPRGVVWEISEVMVILKIALR